MKDKILANLETQLNHRLEKLWRVFSWSSSILISIIAAVIAATRLKGKSVLLFPYDHTIISVVILVITIYAWQWLNENLKFETAIRDQTEKIIEEEFNYPEIKKIRPDQKAVFGYKDVIILLCLVALAATWLAVIVK